MALVLEERKNPTGILMSTLTWVVVLMVLGGGSYYVFFKNPELVPVAPPPGFAETQAVSGLTLDPQAVIRSLEAKGLKAQVTVPPPNTTGRANPFLP